MSNVMDRPEAGPLAAGSGSGYGWDLLSGPLEDPEGQLSPLAEPLAGWMTLAECASALEPGIGDVMRSAGLLARAAIEDQAPELSLKLTDILTDSYEAEGLARPVVAAEVYRVLEARRLALTPELAARNLADSVDELGNGERNMLDRLSQAAGSLPDVTALQPTGLYNGVSDAALQSAGAFLASEVAGVQAPQPGDSPERFYFGRSGVRWWLTASLELPESIGGQHPVRCMRPQARRHGDRVDVVESTYLNFDVDDALVARRVRAGEIPGTYRSTHHEDEVDIFADIVRRPLDYRSYVCRALIEPDSRASRSISRIITGHKQEISDAIDSAAQAATAAVAAIHPAAVLAMPLMQLLTGLFTPIVEHLVSALAMRTGPRTLPAWLISHTVIWANDTMPLSLFLLRCPDEPRRQMRLHAIRGVTGSGGTSVSAAYGDLPKDLYFHGRLMWGASRPDPARPGLPDDLWSVVDTVQPGTPTRHPVIWTQPEFDRRGFRVLVPQCANDARYVAALRADIRFT